MLVRILIQILVLSLVVILTLLVVQVSPPKIVLVLLKMTRLTSLGLSMSTYTPTNISMGEANQSIAKYIIEALMVDLVLGLAYFLY